MSTTRRSSNLVGSSDMLNNQAGTHHSICVDTCFDVTEVLCWVETFAWIS